MSAAPRATDAHSLRTRIEAWCIPPQIRARGGEALLRARVLLVVALGGWVTTMLDGILDLREGASGIAWLSVAVGSSVLAVPLVLRRTGSLALAGNLLVGVLFSLVFLTGVLTIGRGPAVLFLFMVPAFAIIFTGRRAALFWSLAAMAAVAAMALLAASPLQGGLEAPHGSAVLRLHRIAFFSLGISIVLLLTYDALKVTALRDLERANRALSESREQFRRLVETCPDAVFVSSVDRILYANSRAAELLGVEDEESMVGRPTTPLMDMPEEQQRAARTSILAGRPVHDARVMLRTPSGERIPAEVSSSATQFDGQPALISILRDRREQERTLERLRLLGTVVDQMHEGVIVVDAKGIIRYVNEAYASRRGLPAEAAIGMRVDQLPRDAAAVGVLGEVRRRVGKSGSASGVFSVVGELGRRSWDVRVFPVQTQEAAGGLMVTLLRDVSREVELEERARQSQKMEAVGQLAGGIAHDFNNHLTVILGHAEELRGTLAGAAALADVEAIVEAAERSATLTQQLLAFARRQAVDVSVLDLGEVVRGVEEMLRRLLPERIELRVELAGGVPPVLGDRGQIEQVVLNLVLNARDAIEGSGHIVVSTGAETPPEPLRDAPPAGEERCAVLRVSDDGHGMDDATRARMFEPFFTTKPAGRGTGLGLSTVHGIVYQGGGAIGVESRTGSGTTVSVYLPVAEGAALAAAAAPAPIGRAAPLGGTVLVVEDEASIRAIARRALAAAGFEVVEAEGGAEALALAAGRKLDLLLTDIVMPGMSGLELADRIGALDPDLPVLFVSGYSEDAIEHRRARGPGRDLLAKPFRPQQLVLRVRQMIDARRAER